MNIQNCNRGVFDISKSNPEHRIIKNDAELIKKVEALRTFGNKIVLTMGAFDLAHIGHFRYMEVAKNHGDFLIVGIDSDDKIRKRKGPNRPVVEESERMEILCHIRHVDLVVLKDESWPKWHIIKSIRPDVLIATEDNYTDEEIIELEKDYCGKVVVLERQATTSTTAKVRKIMVDGLDKFKAEVSKLMPNLLDEALQKVLKND
jgi:rfaE bifunctional protein nucleotidyltransferase chain/domain